MSGNIQPFDKIGAWPIDSPRPTNRSFNPVTQVHITVCPSSPVGMAAGEVELVEQAPQSIDGISNQVQNSENLGMPALEQGQTTKKPLPK